MYICIYMYCIDINYAYIHIVYIYILYGDNICIYTHMCVEFK